MFPEDFDNLIRCETTCRSCELAYAQDPLDAHNLARWGSVLYGLSQFHGYSTAKIKKIMLNDAISKLEEALAINPSKHRALYFMGLAHTNMASLCRDADEAQPLFNKAYMCFKSALAQDPDNETYQKKLESASKLTKCTYEWNTEIFCWIIVAVGSVAWTMFNMPSR